MQKFFTKTSNNNGETLLAVCDEEIAEKTFEDDKAKITVSKSFYCGEICDEGRLIEKMRTSTIINLAGNRCVSVAINSGFVKKEKVLKIGAIKHAQAVIAKYSNIE